MNQQKHKIVYLNGAFVAENKAKISIFDQGLLYGNGLFETMRSYSGYVFRIDEHLNRLLKSSKILNIKIPLTKAGLKEAIYKIIEKNNLLVPFGVNDAYIRLTVTRGEGKPGFNVANPGSPNLFIITKTLDLYPLRWYNEGIKAIISNIYQNNLSPLSNIKSLNYLNNILAKNLAKKNRVQEAIFINTKGYVTEATTSNIFLVNDNFLTTPSIDSGILPGITRQVVLEIALKLKLKIKCKKILPKEIFQADEIFLTNSLIEIIPVVEINKKPVGDGRPGKITQSIHKIYQELVNAEKIYAKRRRCLEDEIRNTKMNSPRPKGRGIPS